MSIRMFNLEGSVSLNISAFTTAMKELKSSMREGEKEAMRTQAEYDKLGAEIEKAGNRRVQAEEATNRRIIADRERTAQRVNAIERSIDNVRRQRIVDRTQASYYKNDFDKYRQPKETERTAVEAELQKPAINTREITRLKSIIDKGVDGIAGKASKGLESELKRVEASLQIVRAGEATRQQRIRDAIRKVERNFELWDEAQLRKIKQTRDLLDPQAPEHRASYDTYRKELAFAKEKAQNRAHDIAAIGTSRDLTKDEVQEVVTLSSFLKKIDKGLTEKYETWAKREAEKMKSKLGAQQQSYQLENQKRTQAVVEAREKLDKELTTIPNTAGLRYTSLTDKQTSLQDKIANIRKDAQDQIATAQAALQSELQKTNHAPLKARLRILNEQLTRTIDDFARAKIDGATRELSNFDLSANKKRLTVRDLQSDFTKREAELRLVLQHKLDEINKEVQRSLDAQLDLVKSQKLPKFSVARLTAERDSLANHLQGLEHSIQTAIAQANLTVQTAENTTDKTVDRLNTQLAKLNKRSDASLSKHNTKYDTLYDNAKLKDYRAEYATYLDGRNAKIGNKADELLNTTDAAEIKKINAALRKLKAATLTEEAFIAKQIEAATKKLESFPAAPKGHEKIQSAQAGLIQEVSRLGDELAKTISTAKSQLSETVASIEKQKKKMAAQLAGANARVQLAEVTDENPKDFFVQKAQNNFFQAGIAGAGITSIFAAAKQGADDQRNILNALANTSVGEAEALKNNFAGFNKAREDYTQLIRSKSLQTGRDVKEIADALREAENVLGDRGRTSVLDGFNSSLRGAVASGGDLMVMTKAATGLMKLFPQEFLNGAQAVNVLNMAARKSPLELGTLAESIGNISNIGKIIGATGTETVALMQVLTQEQIKSTDAATQMRNMMLRVTSPVKQVRVELAKLDLKTHSKGTDSLTFAFSQAGVKALGFSGVLARVAQRAKELGITSGELAQRLFPNLRGEIGGAVAIDKIDQYLKAIEELNRSKNDSSFTDATYEANIKSTATQMEIAAQKTRLLSGELAVALTPSLQGLNNVLSSTTRFFQSVSPAAQKFWVTLGIGGTAVFALYKVLSGVGAGVGLLATGLSGLSGAFAGVGGVAARVALFFATKLNPWVAGATALISLGVLAWNKWGGASQEATQKSAQEIAQTKEITAAKFMQANAVSSLAERYKVLIKDKSNDLEKEAERMKIRQDIFAATGIEIKSQDDLATAYKKLAQAADEATKAKERASQKSYTDFVTTSPDKVAYDQAIKEYNLKRDTITQQKAELAKLDAAVAKNSIATGSKDKNDSLPTDDNAPRFMLRKQIAELEKEMPIHLAKMKQLGKIWDAANNTAFAEHKTGLVGDQSKKQLSGLPGLAGVDAAAEAEKARLQKEKDTLKNRVATLRGNAQELLNQYKSFRKESFELSDKAQHMFDGESYTRSSLRKNEAAQKFLKAFQKDPIVEFFEQIGADRSNPQAQIEQYQNVIDSLKKRLPAEAIRVDDYLVQNYDLENTRKELEKASENRKSIVDRIYNLIMVDAQSSRDLPKDDDHYVRELNKYLAQRTKQFGVNSEAINEERDPLLKLSSKIAISLAYDVASELDKRNKIGKSIVEKLKEWGENNEQIAKVRKEIFKTNNPATDLEVILQENYGGKYEKFEDIANDDLRTVIRAQVIELQAARIAKETRAKELELFKAEATKISAVKEMLLKAKGELKLIGANDYDTFLAGKGLTQEEIVKHDMFGVHQQMYRELFETEQRITYAKEVFQKLKEHNQKERSRNTGNVVLDRINTDLDKEQKFKDNLTKIENGFESAVATGLKSGFKKGFNSMVDSIKNELLGIVSRQLAKGLFDATKKSGIFEKLFNFKGLNDETKSALANPEAFAQAMANKTLNVNVVNMPDKTLFGSRQDSPQIPENPYAQQSFKPEGNLASTAPTTSPYADQSYAPGFDTYGSRAEKPTGSANAGGVGKIGLTEGLGYIAAAKYGGLSGKLHAASGIAKFFGNRALMGTLSKFSIYAQANELLGNPVGKGLNWASRQIFGSRKNKGDGAHGWGNPNASRAENVNTSMQKPSVTVNMPNAQIHQPSDAQYLGTELGRAVRSSPAMIGV